MSVTSDELNYLVWRYLQETGHEVTAFAFQDETKVHELDERYGPKVQIGCLVDLVQKGILYSDDQNLVNEKGQLKSKEELEKSFTLFGALRKNKGEDLKFTGRFALKGSEKDIKAEAEIDATDEAQTLAAESKTTNGQATNNAKPEENSTREQEDEEFIKVLEKSRSFSASVSANWNPAASSVLSWGEHNSTAKIAVLQNDNPQEVVTLTHPLSLSADLSINHNAQKEEITAVSWAPKGHFLLTASENGELRLWTADGKLRNVLTLHHSAVISIRWNFDSTYILTQDSENNTIIWDASIGNAVQHIDYEFLKSITSGPQPAGDSLNTSFGSDAAWLDNSKFAIPGPHGTIVLFKVGEKAPIGQLNGHSLPIGTLSYNSKLQLLASGSDDASIRIWKGNSTSSAQVLLGHDQGLVSADWVELNENKPLIISSSLDGSIRVWDVYSGDLLLASFLDGIPIFESSLSPDKKWFTIATEEGIVLIFDVSKGTIKSLLDTAASKTKLLAASIPQLKMVAQYQPKKASDDNNNGDDFVTSLCWNCDSNKLCVSYNRTETIIIDWINK